MSAAKSIPNVLHIKPVHESATVNNLKSIEPNESKQIVGLGVAACVGLRVLLSQKVGAYYFLGLRTMTEK
jgi:hypothetical protein